MSVFEDANLRDLIMSFLESNRDRACFAIANNMKKWIPLFDKRLIYILLKGPKKFPDCLEHCALAVGSVACIKTREYYEQNIRTWIHQEQKLYELQHKMHFV